MKFGINNNIICENLNTIVNLKLGHNFEKKKINIQESVESFVHFHEEISCIIQIQDK